MIGWSRYTNDKHAADDATRRYYQRKNECPPRRRVLSGPQAALGDDNSYGLGGNFTIAESEQSQSSPPIPFVPSQPWALKIKILTDRELRHLAHDVFHLRKS